MAEITQKRVGELVQKTFKLLMEYPEGMQAKAVLAALEQSTPLSEYEKSDYPNRPGVRRFDKIVRFATIAPVKAGWLVKSKGTWTLTEEGKAAYHQYPAPEMLIKKAAELYKSWQSLQPDEVESTGEIHENEPESAGTTLEEAEELAWDEISKYLKSMNPYDFQALVAALLKAMGYYVSWVSPPGPDKGIDILAYSDPLGTRNPRIKVQVKRQESSITVDGLRSFLAVLGDQDVGIFVSTGGFTSAAEQEARTQEKRKITLLGLERLFDLWVEHYDKIAESEKRLLPLKPVYYIAASE
jgi:restriction system protein